MPRIDTDEWITSQEAASILTHNSGHTVTDNYVRRLAFTGAIRKKMLHERLSLYNRSDVERYKVQRRAPGKKTQAEKVLESALAVVRAKEFAETILNTLTIEDKPLSEILTLEQSEDSAEKLRQALEPWIKEHLEAESQEDE